MRLTNLHEGPEDDEAEQWLKKQGQSNDDPPKARNTNPYRNKFKEHELAPSTVTNHTCEPRDRQPSESWAAWGNRIKNCPGCEAEEDEAWETEVPTSQEEEKAFRFGAKEKPGEVAERTGETMEYSQDQPTMMQLLDIIKDMGGEKWNRRGPWHERYGRRRRQRDQCIFGHTCEDPWESLPIPGTQTAMSRKVFAWSGRPKPEYLDYYLTKDRCPACQNPEKSGCPNKVSTKYGRPKPYCKEHVGLSDYPKELLDKWGEGMKEHPFAPSWEKDSKDPGKEHRDYTKRWKKTQGKQVREGDRVKAISGARGRGIGTVIAVDPNLADLTHRVKWEKPAAQALEITWENPESLDVIE